MGDFTAKTRGSGLARCCMVQGSDSQTLFHDVGGQLWQVAYKEQASGLRNDHCYGLPLLFQKHRIQRPHVPVLRVQPWCLERGLRQMPSSSVKLYGLVRTTIMDTSCCACEAEAHAEARYSNGHLSSLETKKQFDPQPNLTPCCISVLFSR